MNQLNTESANELIDNNKCRNNWAQNSNKRSLNTSQSYERKRFCDNSHNFHNHFDHHNEDEWREYTPFDHLLLNITNRLNNFNMNYVETPEWPEFMIDSIDCNNNKSIERNAKIKLKFPPKVGQTFFGWCLDSLVKTEKRYAIFVGHKVDKTDQQYIIKLGIESGFQLLKNECYNLRSLQTEKAVPKLVDFVWYSLILFLFMPYCFYKIICHIFSSH